MTLHAPDDPHPAEPGTRTARRARKAAQVLEGAREVFLRDGFEGASVDDIARAAGVSKATLYSHFGDKRLLFMEVASAECRRQADAALGEIDMDAPPREVLGFAARRMMDFFLSPLGLGVFRVVVGETGRFPQIGRAFWETGPARGRAILQDYFARACARGELAIDDPALAADQFAELCKADLWPRLVFGLADEVTPAERERVAQGAVDMFMARYGR
jgi:AcrR family transcriptional regulator